MENFMAIAITAFVAIYLFCCFFAGFFRIKSFSTISDKFEIDYIEPIQNQQIESRNTTVETVYIEKPIYKDRIVYKDKPVTVYKERVVKDTTEISKLKNEIAILNSKISKLKSEQIVVRTQEQKEHPLYRDCVDAAVALGCKKREAEKGVREFFATNNVDSIEEFIVKYFKRG